MKTVKIVRYLFAYVVIASASLAMERVVAALPSAANARAAESLLDLCNSDLECTLSRKESAETAMDRVKPWKKRTDARPARERKSSRLKEPYRSQLKLAAPMSMTTSSLARMTNTYKSIYSARNHRWRRLCAYQDQEARNLPKKRSGFGHR